MRWWLAPGLAVVAVSLACGGGAPKGRDGAPTTSVPTAAASAGTPASSTPVPSTPATASPGPATPLDTGACTVRPAGAGAIVADPNGPYYHRVWIANEAASGPRIENGRMVIDHASVPDGVSVAGVGTFLYYVNGATGGIDVARIEGDTVTPLGAIVLDGIPNPAGIVDPDASPLPGGGIRLAYLGGFGPPAPGRTWTMCIADGTDGRSFTVRGAAITFAAVTTDPSLVRLADGSWLMAASQGQATVLARSADGLRFTAGETLTYGGVPELADAGGGRIRLYVCARGIESYLSADGGATWQREGVIATAPPPQRIICDPSRIAGTNLFLYKTGD